MTGCQIASRPRDHFSRYSKWLDTFRRGLVFFSSPERPDRLWGQPRLLFNAYWGSLTGVNGRSVKLTTHVPLGPGLRMSGVIFPLPLHNFMAWTGMLLFIFSPTIDTIIIVITPTTRTKPNCNDLPYVSTLFYLTTVSSHFPSTRLTYTATNNVLAKCNNACLRAENKHFQQMIKYG